MGSLELFILNVNQYISIHCLMRDIDGLLVHSGIILLDSHTDVCWFMGHVHGRGCQVLKVEQYHLLNQV